MLSDAALCVGPLLWYDVPSGDADGLPVAIVECGACGGLFVTGSPLDARHEDTPLVNGDG